jgi:predicted glycosyltransferase
LFFTRGRGSGHAVADMQIARELAELRSDWEIVFISYGTGARTLRENGIAVIDLELPDGNSIVATTVLAGRLIGRMAADLVIAHEEAAALPAAKIFGRPTAYITDYFGEAGLFSTEALWFADRILFLDRKGVFEEPRAARGRTVYVGPVLRRFEYRKADRGRARRELGLSATEPVVGVFPGSWTESVAPLAAKFLKAVPGAQVIWLAGGDAEAVRAAVGDRPNVTVLEREWQVDRLMVACDLAVTKTNRMTVRELAALGIRTLSVTYGLNPPDEQSIAGLRTNTTIGVEELTEARVRRVLEGGEPRAVRFGRSGCAGEIVRLCLAGIHRGGAEHA